MLSEKQSSYIRPSTKVASSAATREYPALILVFGRVLPDSVMEEIKERVGIHNGAEVKNFSDYVHIDSLCSDIRQMFVNSGIAEVPVTRKTVIVLPHLTVSASALSALVASFCPSTDIWLAHWRQNAGQIITIPFSCLLQQFS